MKKDEIKPWRQVMDVTLMIICWLTFSPVMSVPNRYYTYLSRRVLNWLILFSPFTWGIMTYLFLVIGVPVLSYHVPSFAATLQSFPEFTGAFTSPGGWWQMLLVAYFLPVYSFCVVVIFLSMGITGWNYREASVYICEYFEPWFCIGVAVALILVVVMRMKKMNLIGKMLSLIPIGLESILIVYNFGVFRHRVATYAGLNIDRIFNTAVKMLISLGERTHINYITANIIIYILPLVATLLVGYLGWVVYTLNRNHKL